ncbi:hypothetical protein [Nonomuraea sp. NPDC049400]|uniref:hypothetical protein n=1 Tax=Nonomuraea sp. NPDC049400 TaxID=3364352 RepID=UPI00378E2E08
MKILELPNCDHQGFHRETLAQAQDALALCSGVGHTAGQGNALNNIGWLTIEIGYHEQGLALCRRALDIARKVGNKYGEAATRGSLNFAHQHLGKDDKAVEHPSPAQPSLFAELEDRSEQAASLSNLEDTYDASGDHGQPHAVWREVLKILTELDHYDAHAVNAKLS